MRRLRPIALGLILMLGAATVVMLWFTDGEPLAWFIDRQLSSAGQAAAEQAWSNPDSEAKPSLDFAPFAQAMTAANLARVDEIERIIAGKTVPELQALMTADQLSTEELVLVYLMRIQRYDLDQLNSVLALNPDALVIAQVLDAERATGSWRGLLHGIPVLIKDNIAMAGMPTTAGAMVLADVEREQDSLLVRQLQEEGALILGKANLSEWAYFMSEDAPAGYSALGGHTRNPYGRFDVGGSSSGSAAAVAADLVTVAVGTETVGSLVNPAGQNSIFALKPSLGLVSQDGIIPITLAQDTAGPMARSVTDLAYLFTVLASPDWNDPHSLEVSEVADEDFTAYLDPDGLKGVRIGVMVNLVPISARVLVDEVVVALREAGATAVEIDYKDSLLDIYQSSVAMQDLLAAGMQRDLPAYLATLGEKAPASSVADIVAFNAEELKVRAPYGQGLLRSVVESNLSDRDYHTQVATVRSKKQTAIRNELTANNLDFLLSVGALFSPEYASAGFPAITIPAGYLGSGEPLSITLIGDYLSDGKLIAAAYALERTTSWRIPPDLDSWDR